ncbi:MAG: hypothetical protein HRU29_09620 [Rhizobiales bacterium]|nr:thioredoxin family protein [Hyphomicrobiales bacterium]NRB14648.1 hypothetical protein [Hyphomicrobiales bacterium]
MGNFLKSASLSIILLFSVATSQAAELLMFEHVGCVVCKKFKAEMLPKYLTSKYAKEMPIRSIVAGDDAAYEGITLKSYPFYYSPTFILVEDNKELVRIRGFGGEELFWQQIANIYANHKHKFKS